MSLNIVEEKPVSPAEVRSLLSKVNDEGELNFKSLKLFEYLNRTVTLSLEQTNELIQKLNDLKIIRLTELIIIKMVEILPVNKDILRNLLTSMNTTLSEEDITRIMEVLNQYNNLK